MPRIDPNLPPDAQPWAKQQVEPEFDRNWSEHEEMRALIGSYQDIILQQRSAIGTLQYELRKLYQSTGSTYPPTEAAPPATVPPPPTQAETKVYEVDADWSRTWGSSSYYTGSGPYTNATYLYQGQSDANKIGMWHFPLGPVSGKRIIGADMHLANIDIPWQASTVAGFGTHTNDSPPTGKPGRVNPFDVGWSRGEAKWFALPDWTYGALSNGGIKGFTVGGNGYSDGLSAFWQGVGQPSPPRIRISYYE